MKTILIPVDFSDHVSPTYKFAIKIGGTKPSVKLIFLHSYNDQIMIPDSGMNTGLDNDTYMNMQLIEEFKQLAENNMDSLKTEVNEYLTDKKLDNYTITTMVEGSDPGWEITSICDEIKPDLIIMGTQGSGKKGILEGSMAKKIMTRAHIPVIAVPTGTTSYDELKIMYASNNSESDISKIRLLYGLFENIPVSIFAVHFHLNNKSIENQEHIAELKHAFTDEMTEGKFHFTLIDTVDKTNALNAFVENNEINSVAFISHKSNIFSSLFKNKVSKNDIFKLNLPMIALHD